jgi:hypothetical protein
MDLLDQRVRLERSPHDTSLVGLTGTVKFGTGGFRIRLDKPLPPSLQGHPEVALGSVLIGSLDTYSVRDQDAISTLVKPVNKQWPKHHALGQPTRQRVVPQPMVAAIPVAAATPEPRRAPKRRVSAMEKAQDLERFFLGTMSGNNRAVVKPAIAANTVASVAKVSA